MAISPSTMWLFRPRTRTISVTAEPVTIPNSAACFTSVATFALQTSFLLGRQLTFGQEPPIHRRSTTTVRRPALAPCATPGTCRPLHCRGRGRRPVLLDESSWRHPPQHSVPHDQGVEQDRAEVSHEREEEEVREDGVRLPQHRIEHGIVRKDERQMQ